MFKPAVLILPKVFNFLFNKSNEIQGAIIL